MSKRIYISPSNQSGNTYATGNTNEKEQCHKIAKHCVSFLEKNGFDVRCTYNDDMYERVRESNAFGADLHVAIHTNATAKHNVTGGSQVLLYSLTGERKKAGQAVLKRLAPITPGKSAERLVEKPDFYEIRAAKGITLYCECEFHDTKAGSDFIIKNAKKIGEAIAMGICDYYGIDFSEKENNAPSGDGTLYSVQVGAFSSEKSAKNYVEKLKKAGFNGYVVKKN
jgi:N-acetylmuramoyl-L-alanine amidase